MRTRTALSTLCFLTQAAVWPTAQPAPPATIHGRVVAAGDDRVLRRARVVASGEGRQTMTTSPGATLKGPMSIGPLDITDAVYDFGSAAQTIAGAEVVISNAGAAISGHVTDAASTPIGSYSVVVFPTDRSKWFVTSRFLRLARPAQDGSFEVTGLPSGEYWVAATDPMDGNETSGDWLKPETLERLSFRATRVTLAERQRLMTVLRLVGSR